MQWIHKVIPQIFSILRILILSYLGLLIVLYFNQSSMIYFPSKNVEATPESIGLKFELVELITRDNEKLSGWFVPADQANPLGKATILYCHGNAGNIGDRLQKLSIFNDLGVSVLSFDYRGYGNSTGSPSEMGTYIDVETFWQYLLEVKKIVPSRIIAYGESLGGSIASYIAAKETQIGGLVLSSTFTSINDRAQELYPYLPIRLISQFSYDTRSRLPKMNIPILVFHSRQDEVIPFSHGEANFQTIPNSESKLFVELKGGHNDGFMEGAEAYKANLKRFIHLVRNKISY